MGRQTPTGNSELCGLPLKVPLILLGTLWPNAALIYSRLLANVRLLRGGALLNPLAINFPGVVVGVDGRG